MKKCKDVKKRMKKQVIFLILALSFSVVICSTASATSLTNSSQPKYQHDTQNTGQSQYNGPSTNTTKWINNLTNDYLFSPVTGSDGTIYIGGYTGLYALNPNGTVKWHNDTINTHSSPAIGADGTIYIGSNYYNETTYESGGILYALNPNGTKKWAYAITNSSIESSSPTIGNDGTIYIGGQNYDSDTDTITGFLYAINPNGTKKWSYETNGGIESSPAIGLNGIIYIGSGYYDAYNDIDYGYLYAINPNGTKKWVYSITNVNLEYSSPTIGSDGTIYITSQHYDYDTDTNYAVLYAINSNGAKKWSKSFNGMINSPSAISSNGTIYVGVTYHNSITYEPYGVLYALDSNGTQKWNYTTQGPLDPSPTIGADGTIYVADDGAMPNGILYALNPNGTFKWLYHTDFSIDSSPAIAKDGTLYFGSEGGTFYAIEDLIVSANIKGEIYNTSKTVTLTSNQVGTIYYTTNGTIPSTSSAKYTGPINITTSKTLKYFVVNQFGISSQVYTQEYIIDTIPPTAIADATGGIYNSSKKITLYISEPGTIYYTKNGTTPTTSSTKYTGPLSVTSTTTLKFIAVDKAGNKSPIYTQTYTIDKTTPTANANIKGRLYNTTKNITLTMSESGIIYYTKNGTAPTTASIQYTEPISITGTTTLKFIAVDKAGNTSPIYTENYTIDTTTPTASVNLKGGLYNTNKNIIISMSEPGTIYYTKNGTTPTTSSTKYTGPLSVTSTTTLKFIAVDKAGNKSPIYTQTYTIDKTAPKITSTSPKRGTTGISRTSKISVKFSESIKISSNWSKITVKDKYGHAVKISKTISGNTLYIKTNSKRLSYSYYTVYIPASAVKDSASNTLATVYTFKFKTGKY